MVMSPGSDGIQKLIDFNLEPEIYSIKKLQEFINWTKNKLHHNETLKVHLKVDTGMHRLGFVESEIEDVIRSIQLNNRLTIVSVFSHLVASDNETLDDFTNSQIDLFKKCFDKIQASFSYPIMGHILNSAGISRFKNAQFNMVRLGIGMYGISSVENEKSILENVCVLKTTVTQIKQVSIGETVGYNRMGKVHNQSKIATIPIGYADGFNRKLGNGNYSVLVNNALAPTIGNICMDMTMIDVTNIDCDEGDEVIVFGENPTIYNYSKSLDTIPYEILTNVSERVKRVYLKE
jgi:alanine racemase